MARVCNVAALDVQVSEERGRGVEEESESGVIVVCGHKSQRHEGAPRSAVEERRVIPYQVLEPGEQTRPLFGRTGANDAKANGAVGQLGSLVFAREASDGQFILKKGATSSRTSLGRRAQSTESTMESFLV